MKKPRKLWPLRPATRAGQKGQALDLSLLSLRHHSAPLGIWIAARRRFSVPGRPGFQSS